MKVEYVAPMIGESLNLVIQFEDFRKMNTEEGWSDQPNLKFAVDSYMQYHGCCNKIITRDLDEACRHIKGSGTIILAIKSDEAEAWCEVYAVTSGSIIPIITGKDNTVNLSAKTKQQAKRIKNSGKA